MRLEVGGYWHDGTNLYRIVAIDEHSRVQLEDCRTLETIVVTSYKAVRWLTPVVRRPVPVAA